MQASHTIPHISSQKHRRLSTSTQHATSNHTGQVGGTTIGQHASAEKNKNAHTGFHASMHRDPQIHIHTKTGSFKTVPSTVPMQLCLLSP